MDEGSAIAKLIQLLTPTTKLARAVLVAPRETFVQAHDCAAPEKYTGGNHTRKIWPGIKIDWFPAATIPKFLNNCLWEAHLACSLFRTILGKE